MKTIILVVVALFAVNLTYAQWELDTRLTNDPGVSNTSYNNAWCIAASGDTVHVAWFDDRDLNKEIYYKRSTDGGLSWGPDIRLTNALGWSYSPSIVVSGTIVHIVWCDSRIASNNEEIYYKRSEDGGSTWGADTRLTNASSYSEFPSMAISGSVLHVVWTDDRDQSSYFEIYYKRSTDGGLRWESDARISNSASYAGFPSVAASGSVVHVVWEDDRNGNGEVYYKRSEDGGATWGPGTRLTNNPADSWDPCVSVNDSVVHVVWMDKRDGGGYEIYYKRSTDGGLTWGVDTRLTNATGDSEYPNITVSGSKVHIVWQDQRDVNLEIYYKVSKDGGLTWEEDVRLTDANSASQYPSASLSGSVVHVVWYDMRDYNEEIYYKRNPTGNIIVGIDNDLTVDGKQLFTIYPNPANTILNINFNSPSAENITLRFTDMSSQIIKEYNLSVNEGMNSFAIKPEDLHDGLYIIEFTTGNQSCYRKIMIRK